MTTANLFATIEQHLKEIEAAAYERGFRAGLLEPNSSVRLMTKRQVWSKLAISEDMLDDLRRTDSRFPRPLPMGRRMMWIEHEVDAWILE